MKRILFDFKNENALRTACLADGVLTELFIDKRTNGSGVGHIINGVVKAVLESGIVFIDVGLPKNAFMNAEGGSSYKAGQYLAVQIMKDATGGKGAYVSEKLCFNGRLAIVYKSPEREIGISQKITSKRERKRLKKLAEALLPAGYGVIVRTNAEGARGDELEAELRRLTALCAATHKAAAHAPAPYVLYKDNSLLDDILDNDLDAIVINDAAELDALRTAVAARVPSLAEKITVFDEGKVALFEAFGAEKQIETALRRKVWLPCGGYVSFDPVEACVVVDVNTGKFTGRRGFRETVARTNAEAAVLIAAQIRLRNLSGMIIADFIDMDDEADRRALLRLFADEIKKDRIKPDIVGMTELGLVQLTRRKSREPLYRLLQRECPHCGGTGRL
jgi:ribonuclease G